MKRSTMPDCFTPRAAVGSSRTMTRAPKWTARAMETTWRWPPESWPTSTSTLGRSMPMSCSWLLVMVFISSSRSRPRLVVSSLPRKKLRHTDIWSTTARVWYTVAMPALRASRGLPNTVGLLSTKILPEVGGWSPARVLMRVDLPAPLSPRTQVTVPSSTVRLTPLRAVKAP